jgi:hypothetical protein
LHGLDALSYLILYSSLLTLFTVAHPLALVSSNEAMLTLENIVIAYFAWRVLSR